MRSLFTELVGQVGKKILTGNFNLTTISFPIKTMIPASILERFAASTMHFSYYLPIAAEKTDKLERFKWVITSTISSYMRNTQLFKPVSI